MSETALTLPAGLTAPPAEVQDMIHDGYKAMSEQRYAEARNKLSEAMAMAEARGSRWGALYAKHLLANVMFNLRQDAESRRLHEEVLAEGRDLNFPWCEASSLGNIGHVHAVEGRLEDAKAAYGLAIELFELEGHDAPAESLRRATAYVERLAAAGRLHEAFAHLREPPSP
jgi:tetratricopeptide (TPR) repeat protein